MTTFIYSLLDPMTKKIRYIGKADNPESRLLRHINRCNTDKNHNANWIRSLISKGMRPIMEIIDEVLHSEWRAAEAAYIIFYQEEGCSLVNALPGGQGFGSEQDHPFFGKTFSAEVRARMSAGLKGKKKSPEHCAKVSAALKGKKASPETRAKLSATHRGIKLSREHRARISAAHRGDKHHYYGKKLSPEHCAKLSVAHRGIIQSPETRAKLSKANKGRKHSVESRAKMSALRKSKPLSPAQLAVLKGRKISPVHRAKISAALSGKKQSAEVIFKRINSIKLGRDRRWVEDCLAAMWN